MRDRSRMTRPTALLPPLWPPRRVWITLASLATAIAMVRAGLLERVVGDVVDELLAGRAALRIGDVRAHDPLVIDRS